MPHQLESWYPRRCRRRGRFRVTPWQLGLDRLLAPQGHPFGRSCSGCRNGAKATGITPHL